MGLDILIEESFNKPWPLVKVKGFLVATSVV